MLQWPPHRPLPKGIRDFSINADGRFQCGLNAPCMATFESEVLYNASIFGTISSMSSLLFFEIRRLFASGSCGASGSTNKRPLTMKLQKVYRSYRTCRRLADSVVVAKELRCLPHDPSSIRRAMAQLARARKNMIGAEYWHHLAKVFHLTFTSTTFTNSELS
ncbi:hypothetical protein ZIOFF_028303 [Zingiber officinale]|uniref:Uncharacterized protein n=1 Tax=Zingiber officinale TaxID=94328 RepID=A0A8J5GV62_ZINOF|nr:hypothetical protein ZIOFF_028303 [Zingiber officinale]